MTDNLTGRQKIITGHTGLVYHLSWASDGRLLLSSGQDEFLRVWRLDLHRDSDNPSELDFSLRQVYQQNSLSVRNITWSSEGDAVAMTGYPISDSMMRVRKINSDKQPGWEYPVNEGKIISLAWSPTAPLIAVGTDSYRVSVCDARKGTELREFFVDSEVSCLAFSPDGRLLAAGTQRNTHVIYVWDLRKEELLQVLRGHEAGITCLRWWPNEHILVSGSVDKSVCVWDARTGKKLRALRNHSGPITSLSVSHDGTMLASAGQDAAVCFWSKPGDWRLVYMTRYTNMTYVPCDIAFHPQKPLLAAVMDQRNITLTAFDLDAIHRQEDIQNVYYSTAKVVVVGEGSIGKTSLCKALVEENSPTQNDGTHTLNVFKTSYIAWQHDRPTRREVYLWDLAGQDDYRLVNQLYLNNVSAALLVFARNNSEPFRELRRWDKVLQGIQDKETSLARPLQKVLKLLVQTRVDLRLSDAYHDIQQFMDRTSCDGFFETSAIANKGIHELREALRERIDWAASGQDITTETYDKIRRFLEKLLEKEDIQIASSQQLFTRYLEEARTGSDDNINVLRDQFETGLNHLEARRVVGRFDFRRLVLLRPELFNVYAASIIQAARNRDNQSFGRIEDRTIIGGDIEIPADKRVRKPKEEEWMLMATSYDLLRFEVALVEDEWLVFPSHFVSGWEAEFEHDGQEELVFSFEGAIINIYAMLVVRLSRSEYFRLDRLSYRKVQFVADDGGRCGLSLGEDDDKGKITVYFAQEVSALSRHTFDSFVLDIIKRESLKTGLDRERVHRCSNPACPSKPRVRFENAHIKARLTIGRRNIICPVCGELTEIDDPQAPPDMADVLKRRQERMKRRADQKRDLQADEWMYRNKQATGNYDVFIEGWGVNRKDVAQLIDLLKLRGIYTLEDETDVPSVAEKVLSVVFMIGQNRMSQSELYQLEWQFQRYTDCALPVIFLFYRIAELPELLLTISGQLARTVYFFSDLNEESTMAQLVAYITGKDRR